MYDFGMAKAKADRENTSSEITVFHEALGGWGKGFTSISYLLPKQDRTGYIHLRGRGLFTALRIALIVFGYFLVISKRTKSADRGK